MTSAQKVENRAEVVVLDWLNIARRLSYSILSGAVAPAFATEPDEIAHRIMKMMFVYRAERPDATFIFANDTRPYWRHEYLFNWYVERGLEPVEYKGNRKDTAWVFATPKEEMTRVWDYMLVVAAKSVGGQVIQDVGLEADDIWGVITATAPDDVHIIGYSSDSDWRQCIKDNVQVYDISTGELHSEPTDVRIKWIGGDRGDNVKGCTKLKKDGTPSKTGWGETTSAKLLKDPDWESVLDPDELTKNKMVTTLPCPEWNVDEAMEAMLGLKVSYEQTDEFWTRFGITPQVQKLLALGAERAKILEEFRMFFMKDET